jgi:hypothetical protein
MLSRNSAATGAGVVCGMLVLMLCLVAAGCKYCKPGSNSEAGPPPTPTPSPTAKVTLVAPSVIARDLGCGQSAALLTGPPGPASVVSVNLAGTADCPATLLFQDKRTEQFRPAGVQSTNAAGAPFTVTLDANSVLFLNCPGDGDATCSCEVTRVDPPLPPGVTLGPPVTIPDGGTQTNPTTPPPIGTNVRLTCGMTNVPLWSGNQSYVTVTLIGSESCTGRVAGRLTGQAGSEEITDERPFSRTLGPVNEVTASCVGDGQEQCQFQITQVVELPK